MILEGGEERVARQPGHLRRAKRREVAIRQRARRIAPPRGVGGEKQRKLALVERAVVHVVPVEKAQRLHGRLGQQARAHERRWVDEVGIARKRRETLVGRVAIARRPSGQICHVRIPAPARNRRERNRRLIKCPDAMWARQGSRMQQHARAAFVQPAEEGRFPLNGREGVRWQQCWSA